MSIRSLVGAVCTGLVLLLHGCADAPQPTQAVSPGGAADAVAALRAVDPPFRTYDAETFFATTSYRPVSGRAFSADGSKMLVSSDATGIFNAYAIDRESGEATPLTESADHTINAVSFFPGDDRILYAFDEGGNERTHVVVRELDGTTRDLTPGEETRARFAGWHESGNAFFVLTNERDPQALDLYRYEADRAGGYPRTLLYENTDRHELSDVSPDGRYAAISEVVSNEHTNLFVLDLSAEPTKTAITPADVAAERQVFTFTPDSTALVYGSNENSEFQQAMRYDLESGSHSLLVAADWDIAGVLFSNTGRYRVTYVNADAVTEVAIVDRHDGDARVELREVPRGQIGAVRFSPDDSAVSFLVNADTRPSDLFAVDLSSEDRTARAYTDALNPVIARSHLVESEVVRYPSFDGLEIPATLYRPKQASADQPVPAVVWVHGGPGGQTRTGYRAMFQHLVNHGYAILGANNRGSSGYGKTYYHLDDRRHGEEDLRDIVAARAYLDSLDWVDGDRVAIMGGSYGGYMTAAALAFQPEAFDAGIDIFGVTNWVRTLTSIPPWWESFREALYDEMGDPAVDAERHRQISPLFHASNIVRPLLVVQGANDPRVLQVESDELVEAVRQNGVDVEYLVFDDEGHGFRKRSNRIAAQEAYLQFLDAHLKNRAETPPWREAVEAAMSGEGR